MKVTLLKHRNKRWYAIEISKNDKRLKLIKAISERKWSRTHKKWLIPENENNKQILISISKPAHKKNITAKKAQKHQALILKGNRLRIPFYPTVKGMAFIKSLSYWQYNDAYKHWTIPFSNENLNKLKSIWKTQGITVNVIDQRNTKIKPKFKYPKEYQRHCPIEVKQKLISLRYSESTIKTYTNMLKLFFTHHYAFKPQEITNEQIRAYLRYLIQERKVSESYQNQAINAIKFYYEKVLGGSRQTYYIDRPKKSKYLPTVLSQNEIKKLLEHVKNIKHKTILTLIYSGGLRISELLALKLSDIDFDSMRIHIVNAKGKKDRYVPLAKRTKQLLTIYLKKYNPEIYVIEGLSGGMYSSSSVQKFLKRYCIECNITKNVTPHTLRHSLATHMLENGIDLRYIQHILGHSSSKTTEIYTHITQKGINNIINPLDQFDF